MATTENTRSSRRICVARTRDFRSDAHLQASLRPLTNTNGPGGSHRSSVGITSLRYYSR